MPFKSTSMPPYYFVSLIAPTENNYGASILPPGNHHEPSFSFTAKYFPFTGFRTRIKAIPRVCTSSED